VVNVEDCPVWQHQLSGLICQTVLTVPNQIEESTTHQRLAKLGKAAALPESPRGKLAASGSDAQYTDAV
jgi:hypothetical protein